MTVPVNEARGEVAVTVDGVELVLAAEMEKLAMLSAQLKCATLQEFYQRISGSEPAAMYACLNSFVVRGDSKAAKAALSFSGMTALGAAMMQVLAHHVGSAPEGNSEGAEVETTAKA